MSTFKHSILIYINKTYQFKRYSTDILNNLFFKCSFVSKKCWIRFFLFWVLLWNSFRKMYSFKRICYNFNSPIAYVSFNWSWPSFFFSKRINKMFFFFKDRQQIHLQPSVLGTVISVYWSKRELKCEIIFLKKT